MRAEGNAKCKYERAQDMDPITINVLNQHHPPSARALSLSLFLRMSSTSTVISENSVRVNYLNELRIVSIEARLPFCGFMYIIHFIFVTWIEATRTFASAYWTID